MRLLSVPLLIGLAGALFHLLTAPAYTVHGATVRGNTLIEAQTIYRASMIDGQNLFLLDTYAAVRAIKRLPYIKQAWIRARPPAQVAIIIQEHQPRWMWVAGDNRFWIDETGNVLPDNGPLDGALTVIDSSDRPLPIGSSLDPQLVEMLNALSRLMPDIQRVIYKEDVGFTLIVDPGWPVRIGDNPKRLTTKIGVLNSLLPELVKQSREVDLIDLRYPERPYYRLK